MSNKKMIAYLITQYPKVSHTFIRREITALERQGIEVVRIALRGWDDDAVIDPDDLRERARTMYVLQGWTFRLKSVARSSIHAPQRPTCSVALRLFGRSLSTVAMAFGCSCPAYSCSFRNKLHRGGSIRSSSLRS